MRQVEKDTVAALGLSGFMSGEYLLAQKEHLPGRETIQGSLCTEPHDFFNHNGH